MPIVTCEAVSLYEAFSNAHLFTTKDDRPVLRCVRIVSDGGGDIMLEATDSYGAIQERVLDFNAPEPFEVFVDRADVFRIIAAAKAVGQTDEMRLEVDEKSLTAVAVGRSSSFPLQTDIAWPKCQSLFDAFEARPTAPIALGADQMLRLGKLKAKDAFHTNTGLAIKWECGGDLKPSRFSVDNGRILGLVMPVRLT